MRSLASRENSLVMPALAVLALFFLAPVAGLLAHSFIDPVLGLQNYARFLGNSAYLGIVLNTFLVAGTVAVVTTLLGFPVAWAIAIMPKRLSAVVFAIVLLSMWTNLLARTYAWMVLLQRTGLINKMLIGAGIIDRPLSLVNNLTGVVIGMTYVMLPFFIIPVSSAVRGLDPRILQAAALCGATRTQAFFRIFLPLMLPSIGSGALLIFVMALGYFITPALLGSPSHMMLGELIAQLVQSLVDWGLGGAAALFLLVVTTLLYAIQLKLFKPAAGR